MSRWRATVLAVVLIGVLWLIAVRSLEAQCAMCRTALESSEQGRAMAVQFNRGILFLLGAPFGVASPRLLRTSTVTRMMTPMST